MSRKFHSPRQYAAIAGRVLNEGAVSDPDQVGHASVIRWEAFGKGGTTCKSPVFVELNTTMGKPLWLDKGSTRTDRHSTEMFVRCRKCPPCLKARAAYWRTMCATETQASQRTWFGTLTLSPEHHFIALARACLRLSRQGVDFNQLDGTEQFRERVREISPELTRYLKRLRKESGAKLRYCLVAERHKSGLPHWHMLVHEVGTTPVRHIALQSQWRLGFSNWKLVADNQAAAHYVSKYLSKCADARVRASLHYGAVRL